MNKLVICLLASFVGFSQEHPFMNPGGDFFSVGAYKNRTASIALGDLNNDGFLDIAIANIEQENVIYFGNGNDFKKELIYE